jgi:transcription factor C subunit 7
LKSLFTFYDEEYRPTIKPSVNGETIEDLHNRTAYALHRIIEQADREGVKAIAICTHAATLIAIGRVLTGNMPEDIAEQDFKPFTCGVSTFVRKGKENMNPIISESCGQETPIPQIGWKNGKGVGGGWNVIKNGDCSFLRGGEERGW